MTRRHPERTEQAEIVKLLRQQAKRSKFNAKPVVTEEGRFDSQGEYGRWCELKMLQKAKKIQHLARQVRWPLDVDGQTLGHYVCDFKYYDVDLVRWVVEDFKGVATPLYKWKKAHMEAQHGITILETKSPVGVSHGTRREQR